MVDDIDKEMQKLSPQTRIKKLKGLEEKNKKEIEKAHRLIKESEAEIAIEEKLKDIEIPQKQGLDVLNPIKKEESLEETVAKEKPRISEEELKEQRQYIHSLPTQRIEQRAEYLQQRVETVGYLTNNQINEVRNMYQELRKREDGIRSGSYKAVNENIEEQIDMTKKILKDIYRT